MSVLKSAALLLSTLLIATDAFAGVTIHYQGELRPGVTLQQLTDSACQAATDRSWQCVLVSGDEIPMLDRRTADSIKRLDQATDVAAEARGAVIYADPMCEPLYLVFGARRRIDNSVKTQFAGAEVHIGIVEVLAAIKPYFAQLTVDDEGGYWQTRDRAKLTAAIAAVDAQLAEAQRRDPSAIGPMKTSGGRIIDLKPGK